MPKTRSGLVAPNLDRRSRTPSLSQVRQTLGEVRATAELKLIHNINIENYLRRHLGGDYTKYNFQVRQTHWRASLAILCSLLQSRSFLGPAQPLIARPITWRAERPPVPSSHNRYEIARILHGWFRGQVQPHHSKGRGTFAQARMNAPHHVEATRFELR